MGVGIFKFCLKEFAVEKNFLLRLIDVTKRNIYFEYETLKSKMAASATIWNLRLYDSYVKYSFNFGDNQPILQVGLL